MPLVTDADARTFDLHASTFTSFVAPTTGSTQLCAWRLDVVAGTTPVAHRVSHEEVLFVLDGELRVELDAVPHVATAGQAVFVAAGSWVAVTAGPAGATAWVTTSVGLTATTNDGTRIVPPWTT